MSSTTVLRRLPGSALVLVALAPCAAQSAHAAERSPFSATLSAGVQYDSNVSVDEADLNIRKGDQAALLSASAKLNLIDSKKATLRVGYDFDQTLYQDITDFDLQIHSFSAGGSYRLGKVILGVDYQYSHISLDRDSYLDMQIASPSVSMFVTNRLFLRGAYTYLRKSFVTSDKFDANTHMVSGDAYRFFARRKGYVAVGLRFDDEKASGAEYRYHALQGSVRAQVPFRVLGTNAKAKLSYTYAERDYLHDTPSIGEKRHEKRSTWTAGLDIALTKSLTLKPQFRYIDRHSNVPVFDYREHVITSTLSYKL